MAVSTALRFRNRAPLDSVVLLDALGGAQQNIERVLFDSIGDSQFIGIVDSFIAKHQKILPGERIATVIDSDSSFEADGYVTFDSFAVTDLIVVEKSTRKTLVELVLGITDAGFITDKDYLRYRQLTDSLLLSDGFQKSIIKTPSVVFTRLLSQGNSISVSDSVRANTVAINKRVLQNFFNVTDTFQKTITQGLGSIVSRTVFDDVLFVDNSIAEKIQGQQQSVITSRVRTSTIDVTDDVDAIKFGIFVKALSDSISINDTELMGVEKAYIESFDVTDADALIRFRNRITTDSIVVPDDIIVTRSAITHVKVLADSFTFFDQALTTYKSGLGVSVVINHGIENQ